MECGKSVMEMRLMECGDVCSKSRSVMEMRRMECGDVCWGRSGGEEGRGLALRRRGVVEVQQRQEGGRRLGVGNVCDCWGQSR